MTTTPTPEQFRAAVAAYRRIEKRSHGWQIYWSAHDAVAVRESAEQVDQMLALLTAADAADASENPPRVMDFVKEDREMDRGDVCRARCGAQARYLGDGRCLFVSAMCNELSEDEARPATGGEERLPLPDDDDLTRWKEDR